MLKGAYIMKLNNKLKIVSIMVLFLMVGLAGCGKGKQSAKAHDKPQEISIYKDNRVWFVAGDNREKVTENTEVEMISIIKDGKIKTYNTQVAVNSGNKNFIMKNFVKLSQAEILREADKANAQQFSNYQGINKEYIPKFQKMSPTVKIEGKRVITESMDSGAWNDLTMSNQSGTVNGKHFVGYRDVHGNGVWTLTNEKNVQAAFDTPKTKGVTEETE